jgi:hypothetical protein
MTNEVGFYHPLVGYWQANADPSAEVLAAYPEGTQRITLMPEAGYTYNGAEWVPPTQEWRDEQAAKQVRSNRKFRLVRHVDPVAKNALRWSSLTAEQQAEWAAYRTALLNIPEQAGFPHNVVWPTKPVVG